jgi:uncharacterized protein YndB with AHSA1/START domain
MTSKVYIALRVPLSPQRAFELFTEEIATWWQASPLFAIAPEGDGMLRFEPGVGGRLVTKLDSGEVFEIGRISVWEPGQRLVFAWRQKSFDPGQVTEVEVRFEPVGEETRVSIEHRGWDRIPREHAARHGFPDRATLEHVARWWRTSLDRMRAALAA